MTIKKPVKPRSTSIFEWFFNHKDMITTLNYIIHNKGKKIEPSDIEKHLGYSEYYLKHNILKHLKSVKIIKTGKNGIELSSSPASKNFLKLNDELIKAKELLPIKTED
jgi:hypothetical protein